MRFQLIVCPLLVLFQQLFDIPLFLCPMKAVRNFESPLTLVMIANAKLVTSPPRRIR